jgi:cytochrome c
MALLWTVPADAQNATAGKGLAQQRCQICHSFTWDAPAGIGPNLVGVFGRKAGAAKFPYSPAMANASIVWTAPALDKYLAGPTKAVPGTRMVLAVPDARQRADIIAYLRTLK